MRIRGMIARSPEGPGSAGGADTGESAAVTTPVTPDTGNTDDSDNFDSSGDDFDVGSLNERAETTPVGTGGTPTTPVTTPPATAPAPAAPVTAPITPTAPDAPAAAAATSPVAPAAASAAPAVVQPAAPAAAAPTVQPVLPPAGPQPAPAPAPQPTQTLEQAVAERTKWRNDTIDALAKGHYNLSPELVEEIQATPEVTVPKLMARVYLDAAEAATLGVMQNLPRVITETMQTMREAEQAETDFYKAWPALDKEKHGAAVMQLGIAYRQLNPHVSKDDFIKFVGSQAIVALGLTQAAAPAPAAAPAVTAAPQAPPHRPLTGVVPVTRPAQPATVSPFAQFAEEDLAFDRGE